MTNYQKRKAKNDEYRSRIKRFISNPVFPLVESTGKNLLKLYLNDVGVLTGILYGNNIRAVLDDEASINLGSVYESVVASELIAHGYELFYYDNRHKGEVDFLIDDYATLSAVPIEVKSGKDYTIHSALNNFVKNEDYHTVARCTLTRCMTPPAPTCSTTREMMWRWRTTSSLIAL